MGDRVWMMDEGMTAAPEHRCGTCHWYARGRLECTAPLPLWVRWHLGPTYIATIMLPTDGKDCGAWKAKVKR